MRACGTDGWVSVILLGDVERVTFENAETGFRVVRLSKVQGLKGKKQITIVGIMPSVGKGTRVRVTGELETDRARGERVRTVSVVPVLPETQEGFAKYLASGVVHGIGPGFAARIVKYFGMETLAVLDHASHRLLEIPGLGEARVEKIRSWWAAHRQLSNVLLALSPHGASPQLAEKIVARFGERAAEIVQTSPYRLAIEIRGVGFKTADSLARSQGLALDHPTDRCRHHDAIEAPPDSGKREKSRIIKLNQGAMGRGLHFM